MMGPDTLEAALFEQRFGARVAEHADRAILDLVEASHVDAGAADDNQIVGVELCQPAVLVFPLGTAGQGQDADVRLRLSDTLRCVPGHELDDAAVADALGHFAHQLIDKTLLYARRLPDADRRDLESIGRQFRGQQTKLIPFSCTQMRRPGQQRGEEDDKHAHGLAPQKVPNIPLRTITTTIAVSGKIAETMKMSK